ncbi:phosphatase PAP2 family protein [Georgenia muralis]|uniref:PAP2 superfamily protein n=1 Tax=Georgenia muralis TaxID=154117 RepID=A0A3N4Z5V2_9MICO|nr:phosphatase PAP2 family protein [Georgenia muralis]RPF26510.1 PAP2 superfamily protein [Georgenia muralis]
MSRRATALAAAVLSGAGVWLVWWFFVTTAAGQEVDEIAFEGSRIGRWRLMDSARDLLDVVSVPFLMVVVLVGMVVAGLRRQWWLAVAVVVVVAASNVTTQVLKNTLERPDMNLSEATVNSLPSGHATVAGSVAAVAILVTAPRWRWVTALLGATYAGATGVSTMVGGWHRASDVVAAILVVGAWTFLTLAVLGPAATPLELGPARRARLAAVGSAAPASDADGAGTADTAGTAAGGAEPHLSRDGFVEADEESAPAALRATRTTEHLFGGAALFALLLALLSVLVTNWLGGDSRTELVVAYAGAAVGVGAVTALTFLAVLRLSTPRVWH